MASVTPLLGTTAACEFRMMRSDGEALWMDLRVVNLLDDPDVASITCTLRDRSERWAVEQDMAAISRLYEVLSEANQAIVRSHSISGLYSQVCQIAVKRGKFAFAAIVLRSDGPEPFEVAACLSQDINDCTQMRTLLPQMAQAGQGPVSQAFATGKAQIANEIPLIENSRRTVPSAGEGPNVAQLVALPLVVHGAVQGVATLISIRPTALNTGELRLLDEIAQDLAFAMVFSRHETERLETQGQLKIERDRLDVLFELPGKLESLREEDFLQWLVDQAERLTSSQLGYVHFVQSDGTAVQLGQWSQHTAAQCTAVVEGHYPLAQAGIWADSVRSGKPVIHNDYNAIRNTYGLPTGHVALSRHMCVASTADAQVRLVLGVGNKVSDYDESDMRQLSLLVNGAAAALNRRRALEALSESEIRHRRMYEENPMPMLVFDVESLQILSVNEALVAIYGFTRAELLDMLASDLATEADAEALRHDMQILEPTGVHQLQRRLRRKDGSEVITAVTSHALNFLGHPARLAMFRDITDQHMAQDQARRHAEDLERAMNSAIQVVQTLSELRDPYTHGHERRVGDLAAAIGREMGMTTHEVNGLRIMGFLHDVGKIGLPTEILSKPGRLTAEEFALIKCHSEQGFAILKDLDFPWPVAQAALQHHERLDGSGYPAHLQGDQILLEARILAVADVVEAISSHRPYRPSLGADAALAEIEQGAGVRYDPAVVQACVALFRAGRNPLAN